MITSFPHTPNGGGGGGDGGGSGGGGGARAMIKAGKEARWMQVLVVRVEE